MTESGFREVQLSAKQAVFLFMALVVAAVGVFLLGVRVGRGVVEPDVAAQATPAATDVTVSSGSSGAMPPATTPAPGELKYHETLQGRPETNAGASVASPKPTATSEPATPTPTVAPATSTSSSKPAPTIKPTPTTKPAATTAVWSFQVNSFSSTANASKEVAKLKGMGIEATIVDTGGTGARYKVKVGPLERAAADAARSRLLKEGYKPFPVSR